MKIGGRDISPGAPVYVVAELSANHNGSLDDALRLVDASAQAGADAVKLQTYTPDTITIKSDREEFRISAGTVWDGRTLHSLYAQAYTPWEWHAPIRDAAIGLGMHFFSSPFDDTAVDFLETLDPPAFKIASFEIVDLGLIRKAASTGRPLIISTGMATLEEIAEAVAAARSAGATQLALLKCTSAYPSPPEEMNLRTIPHLAEAFDVPVGLSDHTLGWAVPVVAVAQGATIVEKHLSLSRSRPGPDSAFSLEPNEFRQMVDAIRVAERSLGRVSYQPTAHERDSRTLRRSLFVVADMEPGELFSEQNVRSIRPARGLHTRHLPEILGRRASRRIDRGTPLAWDLVAPADVTDAR